MKQAESEIIYTDLIACMRKKGPLIAQVFVMYHTCGFEAQKIADKLGIDNRAVYYLKAQGEQIRDRLLNR